MIQYVVIMGWPSYSSRCELGREACTNSPNLRGLYYGTCEPACNIILYSRTHLLFIMLYLFFVLLDLCPDVCPAINEPVCGNDGVTYSSRCELGREACTNSPNLRGLYYGACKPSKYIEDMIHSNQPECHTISELMLYFICTKLWSEQNYEKSLLMMIKLH